MFFTTGLPGALARRAEKQRKVPKSRFLADVFLTRQFLTFVVVGIAAAALHWLFRYFINMFVSYQAALVIAYALSLGTGFILTRRFVFPLSRKSLAHQASFFFGFHLSMFPVVIGVSYLLSEYVLAGHFGPGVARGIAHAGAVMLPAGVNFLLQKYVAFAA